MNVKFANKTDTELYVVAGTYTEDDGTETHVISFFLTDDPFEGITPVLVPHPPDCLTANFPSRPEFNPPPNHSFRVGQLTNPITGDISAVILAIMDADEDEEDPGVSTPPAKPPVKN